MRTAISKMHLIDATVRSLFRHGYGATSISTIVEEAKSSRGALLHHFPTKTELMLAVVRHSWELDRRYYRIWLSKVQDPEKRLMGILELSWKALSRPTGVAVLEILIACRSDTALAEAVVPLQLMIQQQARRMLCAEITTPLAVPEDVATAFFRFSEATQRGLVADLMITRNADSVQTTLRRINQVAEQMLADYRR